MSPRPTLIVVSSPAGSGKTTLAERAFVRVAMDAPSLEVDTTDGYRPGLDQIVAFVNGRPAPRDGTAGA